MGQDILEKLERESEPLCKAARSFAGDKWEITGFEKINSSTFAITMANRKKPKKIRTYKCVYDKYCWYFLQE